MKQNSFRVDQSGMMVLFVASDDSLSGGCMDRQSHYDLYDDLLDFMRSIYFFVCTDKEVQKKYKCLAKDCDEGQYNGLKFRSERYRSGFKLQFFQDAHHENLHGGFYDFDKYAKAPYLLKKQFDLTARKIRAFFEQHGVLENIDIQARTPHERVMKNYILSCHHPEKSMNDPLPYGCTSEFTSYRTDKDGNELHNGDIRYYRNGWNGYLYRGEIWNDINGNWMVITGSEIRHVWCNNLFSLRDDTPRGRIAPDRAPKQYKEQKATLATISTKTLEREIRRRKHET